MRNYYTQVPNKSMYVLGESGGEWKVVEICPYLINGERLVGINGRVGFLDGSYFFNISNHIDVAGRYLIDIKQDKKAEKSPVEIYA